MRDNETCVCGHEWDEHDPETKACEATYDGKPCHCFYFEANGDDEEGDAD